MKISYLIVVLAFFLLLSPYSLPSVEDSCGTNDEDIILRVQPIDTTGLVLIFFVSGTDPVKCRYDGRYDSTTFRTIRSVLPTYARDLVDTAVDLSMVNYFRSQSREQHFIKGIVL